MRARILIPVALGMALAAGTAHAQIVGGNYINGFPAGTLAPPTAPAGGYGSFLNNRFGFMQGAGSVSVVPGASAFTAGPNIQTFPGYGGGFYGGGLYGAGIYGGYPGYGGAAGYGGNPGYGVFVPAYGGYIPGGYAGTYNGVAPEFPVNGIPTIEQGITPNLTNPAVNAAADLNSEVVPPINDGPNASSRTPAERRALRELARREREEEARVAQEYQSLVRADAVVPGTLIGMRNNMAQVRYETNGRRQIGRFSKDQVFFTADTRMEGPQVATLASEPGLTQAGDRVMVALPQSVTLSSNRTGWYGSW